MKKTIPLLASVAVELCLATPLVAATARTATENFVTNKIAAAISQIPPPDFSTNNTELVATIEATAPAPGNYVAVSNAAVYAAITNALQDAELESLSDSISTLNDTKASKADATLTERGFSEWVFDPETYGGEKISLVWREAGSSHGWQPKTSNGGFGAAIGDRESTNLTWIAGATAAIDLTATRTALPGYQLGNDTNHILAAQAQMDELSSSVAAVSSAATNYTNASISPTSPAFSNAVLSVGLGIDTDTVAVINELVDSAHDLPVTGATSVGALLLALAAAVAALKKRLPYALVEKTIENGAVTLDDRASNAVEISATLSPNTLTVNFPAEPIGKVHDFALRLNIASGVTAPELVLPQGVVCENADGEVPEISDGGTGGSSTILYFSETENNGTTAKFLLKGETLAAIAH